MGNGLVSELVLRDERRTTTLMKLATMPSVSGRAVFSNSGMSLERSEIGDAKRVDLL